MTTTKEINIGPKRPAPLDNTKLHSPEVRRRWHAEEQAYWASVNAARRETERKAEAERAYANRTLTEAEYFQMAVERENRSRRRRPRPRACRWGVRMLDAVAHRTGF